jgi:hypothetical protein
MAHTTSLQGPPRRIDDRDAEAIAELLHIAKVPSRRRGEAKEMLCSNLEWWRHLINGLRAQPKSAAFNQPLDDFIKKADWAAKAFKRIRKQHLSQYLAMSRYDESRWYSLYDLDATLELAQRAAAAAKRLSHKPRDLARYMVARIALDFFTAFSPGEADVHYDRQCFRHVLRSAIYAAHRPRS